MKIESASSPVQAKTTDKSTLNQTKDELIVIAPESPVISESSPYELEEYIIEPDTEITEDMKISDYASEDYCMPAEFVDDTLIDDKNNNTAEPKPHVPGEDGCCLPYPEEVFYLINEEF